MPGLAYREELKNRKRQAEMLAWYKKWYEENNGKLEDPSANLKPNHSAPSLTDSGEYIYHYQMYPNSGAIDNYSKENQKNRTRK